MILGLGRTRYSPIAIDFGADALKLMQVVPGDPPRLIAAACAAIPPEFRTDPAGRYACHGELLKRLLKQHPFRGRRAICSIPTSHTLVQHVQVGRADSEAVLEEQIHQHLRQRMNVDPTRMVVRQYNVATVMREGSSKQEVICIAASREAVMRHIESAHRARLDVVGMHAEPMAMLRAFGHLFRRAEDADRTTMFIDIGAVTTKVVIAHGAQMVFAKTIHAAGDHLSRALARQRKLSFADARELRINELANARAAQPAASAAPVGAAVGEGQPAAPMAPAGVERRGGEGRSGFAMLDSAVGADEEPGDGEAGAVAAHATARPRSVTAAGAEGGSDIYDEVLDCIIDELQLAVRYHQSTFPRRPVEKLVFLGGEAHHVDICQRLARGLGIGAQLGDPLARLVKKDVASVGAKLDLRRPQPGWAVPLGLCLSDADM